MSNRTSASQGGIVSGTSRYMSLPTWLHRAGLLAAPPGTCPTNMASQGGIVSGTSRYMSYQLASQGGDC